jgi:hypothetical protein
LYCEKKEESPSGLGIGRVLVALKLFLQNFSVVKAPAKYSTNKWG